MQTASAKSGSQKQDTSQRHRPPAVFPTQAVEEGQGEETDGERGRDCSKSNLRVQGMEAASFSARKKPRSQVQEVEPSQME